MGDCELGGDIGLIIGGEFFGGKYGYWVCFC